MIRTIPHGINIAGRLGFYFQIYCRLDPAQHQHCGRLGFYFQIYCSLDPAQHQHSGRLGFLLVQILHNTSQPRVRIQMIWMIYLQMISII